MTYHQVFNKSNITGATCGGVRVARTVVFCVMFCRSLFVLLSFYFFRSLYCLFFSRPLYCLLFFRSLYCLFFFRSLYCLFFFTSLYCLFFYGLRLLINSLVSFNFSCKYLLTNLSKFMSLPIGYVNFGIF